MYSFGNSPISKNEITNARNVSWFNIFVGQKFNNDALHDHSTSAFLMPIATRSMVVEANARYRQIRDEPTERSGTCINYFNFNK